ncbi:MAG: glycosyltransferase, partial [Actinomycetota bacterium]|nr:glycosyltransferase [Actinomycetota bacterium]
MAIVSYHASPLSVPGSGSDGGMNVYVRSMASHAARQGAECDIFTRRIDPGEPETRLVEPGLRVHSIPAAGYGRVSAGDSYAGIKDFADQLVEKVGEAPYTYDAVHANYWLSGIAAHTLKHDFGIPMVTTFHTLERAKQAFGRSQGELSALRIHQEQRILGCSDAVLVSGPDEADWLTRYYGADTTQLVEVPPGIDRAFFAPGDKRIARAAIGLFGAFPLIIYAGRIQSLKGTSLAVEAIAKLDPDLRAHIVVVGGPSGEDGQAELARINTLIARHGLEDRVHLVPPQPHELLSTYYRAADIAIVPSESESFGLVALEASACGTPVVASDVGGLRSVVRSGITGLLVSERTADGFAAAIGGLLRSPVRLRRMAQQAAATADLFTWNQSASKLLGLAGSMESTARLQCV